VEEGAFCTYPVANIIPAMPTQYKIKVVPSLTRAERWRARAEECRTLADCFTDPNCREQLRQLAQSYDCMAVAAEEDRLTRRDRPAGGDSERARWAKTCR